MADSPLRKFIHFISYPYYNMNAGDNDTLKFAFKSLLVYEFLIGSAIIIKTVLFTKGMAERYKFQALVAHKKQEKQTMINEARKKYIKKAAISQEKQNAVLQMSLGEIQQHLVKQVIENKQIDKHLETLTIEDVVLIHVQRTLDNCQSRQYGDSCLASAIEQSKTLNESIQAMLKFIQESEVAAVQPKQAEQSSLLNIEEEKEGQEYVEEQKQIDEEEIAGQAPQSLIFEMIEKDMQVEKEKKKDPYSQIIQSKPLLGAVIAVSDSVTVEGMSSSYGMFSQSNLKDANTCDLIKQINKFGGIITLKGNPSQGLIAFNSSANALQEQSTNPQNGFRHSGSTSDASLVALRTVNLAVTEDWLGEQRVNAMFNGVIAFSTSRLTHQMLQTRNYQVNQNIRGPSTAIQSKVCFIGRKVEDVRGILQAVCENSQDNKLCHKYPACLGIEFDTNAYYDDRPLRIAYSDENCSSAIKRALLTSYGHLSSMGHELIKINAPLPFSDEIFELSMRLYLNLSVFAMSQ